MLKYLISVHLRLISNHFRLVRATIDEKGSRNAKFYGRPRLERQDLVVEVQGLCKKIRRRDDLADVEVACFGELGQINVRMGIPLFLKKVLQYRFGIDAHEFLSKSTIEEVNIARMNTKAVVHDREMVYTLGLKAIERQHH